MAKSITVLAVICILATIGGVWWMTRLGDEPLPESGWIPDNASGSGAAKPNTSLPPANPSPLTAPRAPGSGRPQDAERVEFLQPADRTSSDPATIAEVAALAGSAEIPKQLLALDLLLDMEPDDAWPLAKKLMASESAQVRAGVVELAAELDDENTAEFLADAVTDSSSYVGYTVLEAADELSRRDREKIRLSAIRNAPAEVASAVLGDVEVESNHNSVGFMIEGLNSSNDMTREESRDVLDFLFDQQFGTAAQAQAWWQSNKNRYDRDLVEKE